MIKNILTFILIVLFIIGLVFYANKTFQNAVNYEKISQKIADEKMLDKKLQQKQQNLVSNLLGALFGKKQKNVNQKNNLEDKKIFYKNEVQQSLTYFALILFLSLFTYFIMHKTFYLLYLNIASLISLGYGIFTPIFLVLIQKDLPIVGNVVLSFESNTLLSSIDKLYSQENYFVAGVIFLFSIIFPLLKTFFMSLALFLKHNALIKITKISSVLSKWSMTDVFVLSIFLIYLSGSSSNTMFSEIQAGFYMFFSYVILSLISATIYNLGVKKHE